MMDKDVGLRLIEATDIQFQRVNEAYFEYGMINEDEYVKLTEQLQTVYQRIADNEVELPSGEPGDEPISICTDTVAE